MEATKNCKAAIGAVSLRLRWPVRNSELETHQDAAEAGLYLAVGLVGLLGLHVRRLLVAHRVFEFADAAA